MRQPSPDARELTIGELAARSGIAPSALRFYEKHGLIHSRRTSGNQRRYRRDTLRRVAFIRASQRVGIPLATIAEALALLPSGRTPTREDWARVSTAWREDLTARITQLQELRDHLTDCIGCGCLSLSRCQLANPGDTLRRSGPGPHRHLRLPGQDQPSTAGDPDDRAGTDEPDGTVDAGQGGTEAAAEDKDGAEGAAASAAPRPGGTGTR